MFLLKGTVVKGSPAVKLINNNFLHNDILSFKSMNISMIFIDVHIMLLLCTFLDFWM